MKMCFDVLVLRDKNAPTRVKLLGVFLPYLLSIAAKHGINKFDAMRESSRDDVAWPGKETATSYVSSS